MRGTIGHHMLSGEGPTTVTIADSSFKYSWGSFLPDWCLRYFRTLVDRTDRLFSKYESPRRLTRAGGIARRGHSPIMASTMNNLQNTLSRSNRSTDRRHLPHLRLRRVVLLRAHRRIALLVFKPSVSFGEPAYTLFLKRTKAFPKNLRNQHQL